MTAIGFHPGALGLSASNRAAWPWLTTLLITVAVFLGCHDLYASRQWQKTVKGDVVSLAAKEANGRSTRQFGFLLLGAIGAGLVVRAPVRRLDPLPALAFTIAALLLWATISAAWSAEVDTTVKRLVILACTVVAALGLIRQFDIDRLTEIAFVHTLLIVIVGVIAEALFGPKHGLGDEYRFAGTLHPNHAGMNASLLLLSSLHLAQRRSDRRLLVFTGVAAIVLMLTKSRTALLGACVGSALYVLLAWPARNKFALLGVLVITIAMATILTTMDLYSNVSDTLLLNRQTSDPTTLTGRTMIWEFALGHVRDDWGRIFAGFGYGGFWTTGMAKALSERAHFTLSEGHNAYIDLLLQLGIAGLLFYLCALIGTLLVWLNRAVRTAWAPAAFASALIAFAVVHHVAESALTAPSFPTLMLWAVIGSAALYGGLSHAAPAKAVE